MTLLGSAIALGELVRTEALPNTSEIGAAGFADAGEAVAFGAVRRLEHPLAADEVAAGRERLRDALDLNRRPPSTWSLGSRTIGRIGLVASSDLRPTVALSVPERAPTRHRGSDRGIR
jgi:hypothetical protein